MIMLNLSPKRKSSFVVIGAAGDTKDKVTYIDNDNKALGKEAVTYLSSHGHKKIGFITDDLFFGQVGQERYRGYKEAADELELEILPELVFSSKTIDKLKKELDRFSPTALIVKDDLIALRLIQWLNNQGIRVPEDYAIIFFQ